MSTPVVAVPLSALGWSADVAENFTPYELDGCIAGRISRVDRGSCVVLTATGLLRAIARPRLVQGPDDHSVAPVVGDWVAVRTAPAADHEIAAVLPRRTAFVRGSADPTTTAQVLASNVDISLITHGLATPPNLRKIERFLALAWEAGTEPVVVLTKSDLHDDPESAVADTAAVTPGVAVLAVSAMSGDGLDALRAYVAPGRTLVLLGPSGSGKSTLVNALAGAELMRTQHVRDDGKGRHTTTHRELVVLPGGGVVIDTPGLRAVQLWDAEAGLAQAFADVEELAGSCRFRDCAHAGEPGCAVQDAVDSGTLDSRRLDGYRRLVRELDWLASRQDARARAERRREWRLIARAQRSRPDPR